MKTQIKFFLFLALTLSILTENILATENIEQHEAVVKLKKNLENIGIEFETTSEYTTSELVIKFAEMVNKDWGKWDFKDDFRDHFKASGIKSLRLSNHLKMYVYERRSDKGRHKVKVNLDLFRDSGIFADTDFSGEFVSNETYFIRLLGLAKVLNRSQIEFEKNDSGVYEQDLDFGNLEILRSEDVYNSLVSNFDSLYYTIKENFSGVESNIAFGTSSRVNISSIVFGSENGFSFLQELLAGNRSNIPGSEISDEERERLRAERSAEWDAIWERVSKKTNAKWEKERLEKEKQAFFDEISDGDFKTPGRGDQTIHVRLRWKSSDIFTIKIDDNPAFERSIYDNAFQIIASGADGRNGSDWSSSNDGSDGQSGSHVVIYFQQGLQDKVIVQNHGGQGGVGKNLTRGVFLKRTDFGTSGRNGRNGTTQYIPLQ